MNHFAAKSGFLKILTDSLATKRHLTWPLFLLLFLGSASGSAAGGAQVQNAPVTPARPGLSFAIADFDGDLLPDLASIQTGRSDFSQTEYWIQLQLTTTERQSIQVVGPVGGLQIVARDINGDRAVDLVLTTAWFNKPVAILLNNGHGNFTRADPAAFPGAINESETNWNSGIHQMTDALGVPPQLRGGIGSQTGNLPHPRSSGGFTLLSGLGFLLSPFLISHQGRAPPSEFLPF